MLASSVMRAVCLRKPMITCVAGLTESKTSPEWITRSTSRSRMASTALSYASCTSTSRWLRPVFGHSLAYLVYPRCVSEMCAMRTMLLTFFRLLSQGYSSRSVSFFLWSKRRVLTKTLVSKTQRWLIPTQYLVQLLFGQTPRPCRLGDPPHDLLQRSRRTCNLTQAHAEQKVYLFALLRRSLCVRSRGFCVNPYGDLSRLHNLSHVFYL